MKPKGGVMRSIVRRIVPRGGSCLNSSRAWAWVATALVLAPLRADAGGVGADDPAALLPESCAVYLEMSDPPHLVGTILDHPLRSEVESTPQFLELRKNPEFQKLQIGLRLVEGKLQKLWRPALETITQEGIAIAADPATEGVIVLVRSGDEAFLLKARDTLLELARNDAEDKGQADPVRELRYRGIDAYRIGEISFAVHGPWLVLTNKNALGRKILDRLLGDDTAALAGREDFRAGRAAAKGDATAWAWVDLARLREAGLAKGLFRHPAEDFGGELLVGGVLAALADADYMTARLNVEPEGVRLAASVPFEAARMAESAEFFYARDAKGAAPPPVQVAAQLASVRAYRDVSTLWLRGPEIFGAEVNAAMANAESNLSTLVGGRSFGEDLLGAVGPRVQLVVATQDYESAGVPPPEIKLPALAAVFTLRDPDKSRPVFKIAFQQLIGFINLAAGQQGYPPLDLNTKRTQDELLVSATYLRDDLERYAAENELEGAARLQANFSPTAAFVGDYFVLSSTRELARELTEQLRQAPGATAAGDEVTVNTAVRINAAQLRTILSENREHLINQNMLEKGHDRQAAEREIGGLIEILDWLEGAGVELSHDNAAMHLTAELRMRETSPE